MRKADRLSALDHSKKGCIRVPMIRSFLLFRSRWIFAALVTLLLTGQAGAEIRIAVIGAFSGQFSRFGDMMRQGAEAAVREINDNGGVLGETIALQFFDDGCDAEKAQSAALASLASESVMIIGHTCSIATEAALPVYVEQNIALFMPVASAPRLTDEHADAPVFRTASRSDAEALEAARYITKRFSQVPVAVLDDGSVYSIQLSSALSEHLKNSGEPAAIKETIDPGTVDYSPLIAKFAEENIAAVFFAGYPIDAAFLIKALNKSGTGIQFLGSETTMTEDFGVAAGSAANGAILFGPVDPRLSSDVPPKIRRLTNNGVEPYLTVLNSYAAVEAWALAVSASGSFDAKTLHTALENGRFSTIRGLLSFDEKGDSQLRAYQPFLWIGDWVKPAD